MSKVEKHYEAREFAELVGLLRWRSVTVVCDGKEAVKRIASFSEVYRMIDAGLIKALKRKTTRGSGVRPHWLIPASEVRRYLDGLESSKEEAAAPRPDNQGRLPFVDEPAKKFRGKRKAQPAVAKNWV